MSVISSLTAAASGIDLRRGWGPFEKGRHAPVSGSHGAAGVRIERTVRPLLFVALSMDTHSYMQDTMFSRVFGTQLHI